MNKRRVFILTMLLVLVLTNSVFAEKKEQVKIEPKVRTEKVIDYQIKHYAYDQWGKALIVGTETFYKNLRVPNGYNLTGTRKEVKNYWYGYDVYTI